MGEVSAGLVHRLLTDYLPTYEQVGTLPGHMPGNGGHDMFRRVGIILGVIVRSTYTSYTRRYIIIHYLRNTLVTFQSNG